MIKNAKVITLSKEQLAQAQSLIPETFTQAQRLLTYLNENPQAQTLHVNQANSIGNIAHVARHANRHLWPMQIQIGCDYPDYDIFNQFGERSNQYLWSIYKPVQAANDSDYRQKGATS